ncbi:MAG: DUF192 domain-containing protein [Candidatus Saccharibacteria bacterium]
MQNKETEKIVLVRKQKSPYIFIIISILIILAIIVGFWFLKQKVDYVAYKNVKIGNETFKLEVADTVAAREKGLGYRDNLPKNQGMLFNFKQDGDWHIWMANMHFNIDIAWLNKEGKIIHIKTNAEPGSYPEAYHTETPSWYVIETPAKSFENLKINEGDIIEIN